MSEQKMYSHLIRWAIARKVTSGKPSTEVETTYGIPDSIAIDWSYRYREDDELWPNGLTSKGDC